jgi:hypothetical protein
VRVKQHDRAIKRLTETEYPRSIQHFSSAVIVFCVRSTRVSLGMHHNKYAFAETLWLRLSLGRAEEAIIHWGKSHAGSYSSIAE